MKNNDFAKKLEQLETMLDDLENKVLPLEESIDIYEKALKQIDELEKVLKEAQERILAAQEKTDIVGDDTNS